MGVEFSRDLLSLVATYLLHSTLFLGAGWIVLRVCRAAPAVEERVWKFAALAALASVPLVLVSGQSTTLPLLPGWPVAEGTSVTRPAHAVTPVRIQPELTITPFERETDREDGALESPAPRSTPIDLPQELRSPSQTQSDTDDDWLASAAEWEMPPQATPSPRAAVPWPIDDSPSVSPPAAPLPVPTEAGAEPWTLTWLLAGWILATLLRLGWQSLSLRRGLARSHVLETGPIHAELQSLLRRLGTRRPVRLVESPTFSEPGACGLFRWCIVLPAGIEQRLGRDELRALLAHELAHLVRGDAWWVVIGRLLCTLAPLQPLNFVARRHWRRCAEFECDRWAVDQSICPLSLARCLTYVAEWRRDRRRACAALLTAAGERSTLSERVERLVEGVARRESVGSRLLARCGKPLAFASLLVIAVWGPRTALTNDVSHDADSSTPISPPVPAEATLENPLTLASELAALDAELDQLARELSALRRQLDGPGVPDGLTGLILSLEAGKQRLADRRAELAGAHAPVATAAH